MELEELCEFLRSKALCESDADSLAKAFANMGTRSMSDQDNLQFSKNEANKLIYASYRAGMKDAIQYNFKLNGGS